MMGGLCVMAVCYLWFSVDNFPLGENVQLPGCVGWYVIAGYLSLNFQGTDPSTAGDGHKPSLTLASLVRHI